MLHISGETNVVADALSRSVVRETVSEESPLTREKGVEIFQVHESVKKEEWDNACSEDELYQRVLTLVTQNRIRNYIGDLGGFAKVKEELWIDKGYLHRGHQMVVPIKMRKLIIELAHVGHLGLPRTKGLVRAEFWWPNLDKDTEEVVNNCCDCIEGNKGLRIQKVPMTVRKPSTVPWDEVALDLLGPFNIKGGRDTYVLVVIDLLSKWPEIFTLRDISSSSIIKCLEQLFWREGFPRKCLSDNGTQLVSKEFREFLSNHGIEQVTTSLYHPQTNGCVERFNRTLMDAIRIAVATGGDWIRTIMERTFQYRLAPHSVTGVSPFELLRGRKPNSHMCPGWMGRSKFVGIDLEGVREKIFESGVRSKEQYDRKNACREFSLEEGDWIKIKLPTKVRKGASIFSQPKQVVKDLGSSVLVKGGGVWNKERIAICKKVNNNL